ncbi:MAG: Rnase Y domain-containing protein, partial [Thermodesulfovibrio sp.]
MELLYIFLAIVIGAVSGYVVYFIQKNRLKEDKIKVHKEAQRILEDAKKEAETIKKEAQLAAK